MPNPSLAYLGTTAWSDNVNNWRAADTKWIQRRIINRFDSETDFQNDTIVGSASAISASPAIPDAEGSVAYINTGDYYVGRLGTGLKRFVLSNNFNVSTESATVLTINHRLGSGASPALSFDIGTANRITVTGGNGLGVSQLSVQASDSSLTTITRSTGASGSILIGGNVTLSGGNLTAVNSVFTGTVLGAEFQGPLTGNVKGNVLKSDNSVVLNATTSVLTGNVVGNVVSSGTSQFGNLRLDGGDVRTANNRSRATLVESGLYGSLTLEATPNTGDTTTYGINGLFIKNGADTANVAGIKISTGTPSGSAPNGTIWVQV